jgi:polar amino acid transport system permease protein
MAEIVRGGLLSVDPGQREAGHSVGMNNRTIMNRIILPQAMRFIIPPTGNQIISMAKATSLVSVIAMADLFYTAQSIYNRTFQTIPLLIVAVIWYLIITTLLNIGQSFLEKHYSRSSARTSPSMWAVLMQTRGKSATPPGTAKDPSAAPSIDLKGAIK